MNPYPSELKVGAAVTKGDNFFDSIAQRLNELKNEGSVNYEGTFTVKSLRKDCADYASQNRGHAKFFAKLIDRKNAVLDDYFVSKKDTSGKVMTVDRSIGDIRYDEHVINEQETYQKYINDVQYTAEEIGNTERSVPKRCIPIWGKPELEGKMICYKYGIKLEVIELRSNGLDEPIRNEYGIGKKRITIVKYNAHFVPLLNSISQDVTRDQEVLKSLVYGTTYDDQNVIKKSIEDLFDKQPDNVQKIIEQLYGYDPIQRVINPFQRNLEDHFVRYRSPCRFFSMFYQKLSNPENLPSLQDFATELAKLWIKLLSNNAVELQPQQISGTYNSLSKLSTYVLQGPSSATFKLLIIGLANRAKGKDFNAQDIANIYNALSKWVNTWNIGTFQPLITQLAEQAQGKNFNARGIANIYNALSKWVNTSNIGTFQLLIIQLAEQAQGKNFNAQDIANIYNALSKWVNNIGEFKTLIAQLAEQAQGKNFNAQHIANIYNALSKWVNNIGEFKTLIAQLAKQAQGKDFNAQHIANIYNALSKWVNTDNIGEFKTLITQLATQAKDKDFNAQDIANIYNALSKWVDTDNIGEFKTLITQLATQAKNKDFNAQEIANIYNALSKWVNNDNIGEFKTLITQLAEQAVGKDFNAKHIANIYNALSKWVNNIGEFKTLIAQLAEQAQGKDFNAQAIANIYNALSKWVNNDNIGEFKTLIAQLAEQAQGKDFNAKHIANIYNALSKWVNTDNIGEFKTLITQLAGQAVGKNFNAQAIANIYNALSKWVDTDNIGEFKTLITQLEEQAVGKDFNAQHIANIYNALSKWVNNDNIGEFKTLITQLAEQAVGKDFNAQEIANIYNALSRYPKSFIEENKTVFQDLLKVLAEIINAKQFQKRGSANIIKDLPKLVEANLITDHYPLKDLLISLMKSFAHREYQNKFVDSNRYFSEENYWIAVGIKDLAEGIPRLNFSDDDKRELKSAFNDNISKILNRLSRFRLNSYRLVSILGGVTKLISLGVVSNNSGITQFLNKLFGDLKRYGDENKLTQETLEFFRSTPDQAVPARHIETDDLRLTPTNIVAEDAPESKRYNLPEDLGKFKEEVLKPQGIEYISTPGAQNLERVFIAEVRVLGKNQWGIYARDYIKAGSFLGIYDGERMSSEEAEKNRKNSAYLFDLSESITIDALKKRNWAAYVNYGISGIANVHSGASHGKNKQIELRAYETVPANHQLLLDYGDNYFSNVDYSPIYLHPTDNWKKPKEHYDKNKAIYSDEVIQLPKEAVQELGLKQEYIAATKLFQAVYSGQDLSFLLSTRTIDLPSYSLELMSDKKWKFSEYDSQQNITPLMLACYLGKKAEVELLLKHSADPIRRTLHGGHNALFCAVSSNAESGIKENILNKLITHTFETLKSKSDAFYASGYEKPSNYNKLLLKDLSQFLQLTDSSGSNIFDRMMDKGEYKLWKECFNYKVGDDEVNNREEKRKIAGKFISYKGILTIIASINEDKNYKEIVEILLENATGKFIEQHLQDLESGEIDSFKTEEIDRILENLRNLDYTNKKGKIVNIVTALLLNETNKLKGQLALGDQVADITTKVQEIRNRFTNVLEYLDSKNKLYTEIRTIERFKTSGCGPSGGGRTKRSAVRCILRADKYIEELRKLSPEDQKQLAQKMQDSTFSGSTREIKQAEKVRGLLLSDKNIDQKSYEISKLIEDPIERRILDLSEDVSQSENSKLKKRFMNAAGRIQLLRGIHGTFASCKSGGLSTDCALSVGEIGFSFFSQLIENGMLKITPRIVKSAASVAGKVPGALDKNLKFAMIARGVAGGITGVFDIVDIGMSANTLIICLRKRKEGEEPCSDKEIRASIAGITFSSVALISEVAFTALAMTGVGTIVGFTLMVSQGVYSGISTIIEYKKYGTTHDENWRIFWHTFALQPIPQDVQKLAADTDIFNQLVKQAWERLESSPNVAAIAMGLGNVVLREKTVGRKIYEGRIIEGLAVPGGEDYIFSQTKIEDGNACTSSDRESNHYKKYYKTCINILVKVPHILPSHASIMMNKTNADTTKLSRIVPKSPSPDTQMIGLPRWSGQEYEYINKGVEAIVDGANNPVLQSTPLGFAVSGIVVAATVAIGSVKPLNKVPHYSENPEAIHPCDNAFVIGNRAKMANYNKKDTVLFLLKNVNKGKISGSDKWKNAFLVDGGHAWVFGGDNTDNTFHLMNETFSGRIYGGNNASNVLDLSNLNGPSILYEEDGVASLSYQQAPGEFVKKIFSATKINGVIGSKDRQEYIDCKNNEEMFINSEGGYGSDEKDFLMNCKKAVIWPYTKATGGEGNYTFYIKTNKIYEGVGRSEIDVRGTGTLVFPDTALLKDCSRIIYSTSSNTLSFEIPLGQNKTFILDVKNYLNEDKTPKFHLIDKHGSNIVPIIKESDLKQDPIEIKSFRLNAERVFTNSKEDDVWYESISQSHGDYQVFGKVKDKKSYRIFGSSGIDVINLSEELVFAHGGSGGDVYRIDDNTGKKIIAIIDNCAEDRRLDLLVQQNLPSAANLDNDLYLYHKSDTGKLPDHGSVIKNYFKDVSCQHLMIKTDDGMFIPFSAKVNYMNSEGEIRLVPFYHASNSENAFLLPENSTEIVIDAKEGDITFYRRKNDLLLLSDNATIPLTIIAKDFYSDPSKWQTIKPYFWNNGEFSSFDLSQKADEAVSYSDKIKSDYGKTVKEYVYSGTFSGEITHNQQRLENGTLSTVTEDEKRIEVLMFKNSKNGTLTAVTKDKKRIGVLIFKDIDPSRIGLAYSNNDLIFFDKKVDHKNLTILNWTDSELEFDKKVDHKNLTTRNWNGSEDHRISRLEFDLESGPIVIQKLDRFDLSEEGIAKMQHAFNVAAVNSEIDKRLKANGEISDNFQCLITMYGLYKGSNTYKCLGFLVLEDQINFAKAYCNSQKLNEFTDKVLKNDQFASLLTQFIIKLHNNLLLNGYQREEIARCSNIVLYEQFARSIDPTGTMLRIRNITNTMNSEIQAQFSNSTTTISENSTAVPVLSSSTNSEIQTPLFTTTVSPEDSTHRHHHGNVNATAQQRNRRAADENRKKENIPSSASRPKSWINTAFDFATKGIAKLGGLIFSSSTDSLPVEHPTLSSQQDSTRNSNATTITQHIDLDGTILLLDVFIRKITGQNYIPVNQDVSLLEVQASALNIIAEFEEILNSVCDEPAIDFAEAQSNIFKAMMSGRGNEIPGILCSYLEEAKLEPEVTQKILAAFQPTKPTSSTSEGQTKHLPYLPETAYDKPQTCLNSIKVENSSVQLCRAV